MNRKTAVRRVGTVLLIALVLPFLIYAVPQVAGADHSYVVLSSSMSPSIQAGDVVVVASVPSSSIQAGDVITFEPQGDRAPGGVDRVTHRVVEVIEREDGRYFRTKGDANAEPDQALVPPANVVGRVMFSIPLIGHVILFAGSDLGILMLIIVPSALLIAGEVWDLWRAARADDGSERSRSK